MDAICSAMLDHVLAFMAAKDAVRATVLQAFASAASADFGMAKKTVFKSGQVEFERYFNRPKSIKTEL